MRRSFTVGLVAVALACGMTACSDQAPGSPLPAETTKPSGSGGPFTNRPSGTNATSQPGAATSPVKDLDPCSLLSAAEVAELKAGPSKAERLNNARVCSFYQGEGFVMGVAIFDELGLDDLVAQGSTTPVPAVGKHKAVQSMRGVRPCAISIEVTKTSRVDIQGTVGTDEQKSCEIALRVAEFVEPRLPQ